MTIKFSIDPVARFETVLRACEQMYPDARVRFRVVEPVEGESFFERVERFKDYATFVEHVRETLHSEIVDKGLVLVEWVVDGHLSPQIARGKIWFENDDPVTRLRIDLRAFRDKLIEHHRNDELTPIRETLIEAGCSLARLATYLELKCRYCGKPVELGCNTCVSCLDDKQ